MADIHALPVMAKARLNLEDDALWKLNCVNIPMYLGIHGAFISTGTGTGTEKVYDINQFINHIRSLSQVGAAAEISESIETTSIVFLDTTRLLVPYVILPFQPRSQLWPRRQFRECRLVTDWH
jgi:hypothetical protein